jgi:hypothetical protein
MLVVAIELTGEARYAKPRAQRLALTVSVDLRDDDLILSMRECIRKLFVRRRQIL